MAPTNFEKAEKDRDIITPHLEYLEKKLVDHAKTPMNEYITGQYLTQINGLKADLHDVNKRMVACAPVGTDMHVIKTEFFDLLTRVEEVDMKLFEIMSKFPSAATTSTTATPQASSNADFRLPRLELPSFDGNLNNWMSFRDMFSAAVHNNASLSKAQKLTYLKSVLKGEAAGLIKTLSLTDANYDIAWKQLTNRYHNERELLFAILRKFMEVPDATSNSSSSIRFIIDVTEESVQSLEVLKLPIDKAMDAFLLYAVFNKLDQTSKELWEQTLKGGDIPSYKTLLEFLEQRARSLAAGSLFKPISQVNEPTFNRSHANNMVYNNHAQVTPSSCKICSGNHPLFKCQYFLSMPAHGRIEAADKFHLCLNCLRDGHSADVCYNPGVCRICQFKHHTLLHEPTTSNSSTSSNKQPFANSSNKPKQPPDTQATTESPASTSKGPSIFLYANADTRLKDSMLATAIVKLRDGRGNLQTCRALCDGGANATIISEDLVRRLGLKRDFSSMEVVGLQNASLGTSNGIVSTLMTSRFSSDSTHIVQALVMPTITSHQPPKSFNPNVWPHLKGLQLADPQYYKPGQIDILLGADVFFEILRDGKKPPIEGSGPTGLNSTLGWLVGGRLDSQTDQVFINHFIANFDSLDSQTLKGGVIDDRTLGSSSEATVQENGQEGRSSTIFYTFNKVSSMWMWTAKIIGYASCLVFLLVWLWFVQIGHLQPEVQLLEKTLLPIDSLQYFINLTHGNFSTWKPLTPHLTMDNDGRLVDSHRSQDNSTFGIYFMIYFVSKLIFQGGRDVQFALKT